MSVVSRDGGFMTRFGWKALLAPLVCATALCACGAPCGCAKDEGTTLDREAFYRPPQGTRTDRHVLQDQPGQLNYDNVRVDLFSPQRRVDVMGLGEDQQPRESVTSVSEAVRESVQLPSGAGGGEMARAQRNGRGDRTDDGAGPDGRRVGRGADDRLGRVRGERIADLRGQGAQLAGAGLRRRGQAPQRARVPAVRQGRNRETGDAVRRGRARLRRREEEPRRARAEPGRSRHDGVARAADHGGGRVTRAGACEGGGGGQALRGAGRGRVSHEHGARVLPEAPMPRRRSVPTRCAATTTRT